jgi:hypothetical protein
VLATPTQPTFNGTNTVTIPTVTGVVYKDGAGTTLTAGAKTLASGATLVVNAVPATGYYFATSEEDSWSFTNPT